jgi:GntR family transcriptional regulator, galactonate operon transcriptional repressor
VGADLSFHRALLWATGNELLTKMEMFLATGLADRDRLVHTAKPADDPVPSHRKVVARIRAGDPAGAERAMRALLEKALQDQSDVR